MIDNILGQKLRPLISAEAALRRRRVLTTVFLVGTLIAVVLFVAARVTDFWSWPMVLTLAGGTVLAAMIALWWADSRKTDVKEIADKIEEENPDLQAALLTALEQKPGPDGKLGYLQERVVTDVVDHALKNDWVKQISKSRLTRAGLLQLVAAIAFFAVMFALLSENNRLVQLAKNKSESGQPIADSLADYEIAVTPGDAEIERGKRLIVEAKFFGRIPPNAMIVIRDPGKNGAERGRVSLSPGLDEQVFAGMITRIDSDAVYRIEFDGTRSDEFNITTFVHPKLEQADATITPPDYTDQKTEVIEDTRKVSLLEGSGLAWSMKVNKPVKDAELFGVENGEIISLKPNAGDPLVLVASHQPEETQKYRLHLVDERERSNKRPPIITVTVQKNLPPKLEFAFPKRDVQVSALQEMSVEGTVWDDIGVLDAGVTFSVGEENRELSLAEAKLVGGKNHPLKTLFNFEELGAKPREFVTYHLWADDIGPDGKSRRTMGDLFFAEVREFEDIFREQEAQSGKPGEPNESEKLLKMQKDIINANWKLVRREQMTRGIEGLLGDVDVVKQSQEITIGMVDEAMEKADDAEMKALLAEARDFMIKAVVELMVAFEKPDGKKLVPALGFEKDAYATLVKAKNREHNITRAEKPSPSAGQPKEQQLMQLEMKQKKLRYEEQRMAEDEQPQTPEQKENLEVLARLKELAKRQEAIAKKIKELEAALQEAKTEEEKAELERQLKRLQEEQKQLLRELDEVTEKMDSEENRANMAEERERLEETRKSVKDTADKLEEGELADAANSATRAQRELEEVKEDFREKTSRQFANEMRDMRNTARELAETQKAIGEKLDKSQRSKDPFDQANSPAKNLALSREINAQQEKLEELLNQMREVSEQSEESEPLLSTALYEGVRESTVSGIENSLAEASQLTRYNRRQAAVEPERAAARGIEELKKDIEAAAEKVLGGEADALRLARSELDDLIKKTEAEAKRLGAKSEDAAKDEKSEQAGKGKPDESEKTGKPEMAGNQKGKPSPDGKGEQSGKGKGEKPDEPKGPGESEGKSGELAENSKGKEGQRFGDGKAEGKGKGENKGEGKGLADNGSLGQRDGGAAPNRGGGDNRRNGPPRGGSTQAGKPMFFNQQEEQISPDPITGEGYEDFAKKLGNIEEMVEDEDLRNEIAKVHDNARAMRIDYRRDNLPPQAEQIRTRITNPLIEMRNRLTEELAKLDKENPLAPIDRDPVPGEFRELVRKYYEELGTGE